METFAVEKLKDGTFMSDNGVADHQIEADGRWVRYCG